jgi:hypothetical protein
MRPKEVDDPRVFRLIWHTVPQKGLQGVYRLDEEISAQQWGDFAGVALYRAGKCLSSACCCSGSCIALDVADWSDDMTARPVLTGVLALVVFAGAAGAQVPIAAGTTKKETKNELTTKEARLAFIRKAQIWAPTNVSEMDLRAGPQGPGSFQPNEAVLCGYVEKKLSGTTPKFECAIGGDALKVRYGKENGEVQGAVLASRLLWALGFGADAVYPVRVTCRGCPSDPWKERTRASGEHVFEPAVIERKPKGHEMNSDNNGGWAWPELELVDEQQGGAPSAQRDALKLLAVFMQHTDTKAEQQRLLCLPGGREGPSECDKPFMTLHDVGVTFGQANFFNRGSVGSVNFHEWSKTPMWKDDPAACVGHLSKSKTGTLGDPKISEAGRQFLANLLLQLTDRQLRDLFDVARVDLRSRRPDSDEPPASIDEWVTAFKHKRDEIVTNRCQS